MRPPTPATAQQLQRFYEEDYQRGAVLTSVPPDDDFMYGQVLAQVRPYLQPGLKVLDLGCNDGALSLYLARQGCRVTGIDLAQRAIEIAARSAEQNSIRNVHFQALDFLRDWREPEAFDLVLCSHVLEHVPEEMLFLRRVYFALKPGGRLVLLCPAAHSSLCRLSRLLTGRFRHDERVGHLRRYTRQGLEAVAREAGFTVQGCVYLDGVLRDWFILCPPLRVFNRLWCRPLIRRAFNFVDGFSARVAFPATVGLQLRKGEATP